MYIWAADTHFDTAIVSPKEMGEQWKRDNPEAKGIIMTGDIANSKTIKQTLIDLQKGFNGTIHFVLGNHDYWYSSFKDVAEEVKQWNLDGIVHLRGKKVQLGNTTLVGNGGWYDAYYDEMPEFGMSDFDKVNELKENSVENSKERARTLATEMIPQGKYDNLLVARKIKSRDLLVQLLSE